MFAFKQNAGVFLGLALAVFTAWQGIDNRNTAVTRALRVTQLLLLLAVVLAAALLISPLANGAVYLYFLVPLAAAGVAALKPVSVLPDGRSLGSWLRVQVWLGLGFVLVTVPWVVVLVQALDGRLDLLAGFVGSVNHAVLWHPLIGPGGGAWASVLGVAVAALLAVRLRHHVLPLAAAVACIIVFSVTGVLLTAEPGDPVLRATLMAPARSAAGLPILLPVACLLAGAWQSLRALPTLATWRLRWLTVAGALTFLTQYPRIDDVHLAWSACLPLAAGAVVVGQLHASLTKRWSLGRLAQVVLCGALLVVPAATVFRGLAGRSGDVFEISDAGRPELRLESASIEMGAPGIDGLISTNEQTTMLLAVVRLVKANTAPGEPIFVYPLHRLIYVAADRPNPTRFAHLYPGAASEEDLRGVIADLRAE